MAMTKGRQAMMPAELRLHAHGGDLARHLATVAQDLREVAQRLGEVAARFLLDADDDAEEVGLGDGHALVELDDRVADRDAERLRLDDGAELGLEGLLRLVRDDAQT